jgi:type I restriction-modification system DNA methylase subunit
MLVSCCDQEEKRIGMSSETATIVKRLWNYCNVLRDDGVSYGDYVEQLTYLLFLKMAEEKEEQLGQASDIPEAYSWSSLRALSWRPTTATPSASWGRARG